MGKFKTWLSADRCAKMPMTVHSVFRISISNITRATASTIDLPLLLERAGVRLMREGAEIHRHQLYLGRAIDL